MFKLKRSLLDLTTKEILLRIGILLFLVFGVFFAYKDYLVANYRKETTGEIIEYIPKKGNVSCRLRYKYIVNNKVYYGEVYVYCRGVFWKSVGDKITVYYSSKKTKYSQVDLRNYEEYRKTIYFFKY
ncbi:hypothetical protein [uncultured Aquimarina sp.]|uniref:hypothetical protein n=1 Tax=uncultured Aquimarina sp. TaxID=575652 RepID=UPI00261C8ADA|nr:hypothetical protein [uncultured Aquimarina sp.]